MSKVHMVKDSGAAFTACGRRHSKVEEARSPTAFGETMPSLACTLCARIFRTDLASSERITNPTLNRHAALRRLAAKQGPAALERLLSELISHQAANFEDSLGSLALPTVDLFEAVRFLAAWRLRLINFVNTHNGVE